MGTWIKLGEYEVVSTLVNFADHEDGQFSQVEMVTLEDARAAVAAECARIRRELEAAVEGDGWVERYEVRRALDRICPEEG